jgi:IPT/TIG domain
MIGIHSRLPFPGLTFLMVLFPLLAIGPQRAAAQYTTQVDDVCVTDDCGVEASAEMATNGTEIDTYSTVENFFDEDVNFINMDVYLSDNTSGALLQVGDDDNEVDYAEVDLNTSVNAPDEYLLSTFPSVCLEDGEEGGGCEIADNTALYLVIDTDYPTINSISPSSVTVGTSGTITVSGQNFIDQFGNYPTPVINNAGVTLSLSGTPTDSQAHVSYSVTTGAATGDFGLNLKGLFGNGEPATLAVGDPSPTVTSVSPSVWYAGNSYTVTITGTNFGTNPTSSISAAPGVTYTPLGGGTDTQTTASVIVAPNAPTTNPITVTVTSNGFGGGSGFFPGTPGGSASASATAQADAVTPAPVIMMVNGVADLTNCTNGTPLPSGNNETDVFAGQQMLLCVVPPAGFAIASATWSFDSSNDITGGFVNGAGAVGTQPSASAGGSEAADPILTQSGIQFYFVNPGTTETASLHWTLNNGDLNGNSSSADFNIQGPTGNLLPNAFAQSNNTGTSLSNVQAAAAQLSMTNAPVHPAAGAVGVYFTDNAQPVANSGQCPPSVGAPPAAGCGQLVWVQILTSVTQLQIVPPADNFMPKNATNQLDGSYPYFNGPGYANVTWDSPGRGLLHDWGEGAEPFNATMYVLWDPALPAGCTPAWTDTKTSPYVDHASTCTSIPIPLGSVQWGWSACAINAGVSSEPSWFLQCGTGSGNAAGVASGYPHWASGTGPGGCSVSDNGNCQ